MDIRNRYRTQPPVKREMHTQRFAGKTTNTGVRPKQLHKSPSVAKKKANKAVLQAVAGLREAATTSINSAQKIDLERVDDWAYALTDWIWDKVLVPLKRFFTSKKVIFTEVLLGVFILMATLCVWFWQESQRVIPKEVSAELNQQVFLPDQSVYEVDKSTVKLDSQSGVFSYKANLSEGQTIRVSQQPLPSSFSVDPSNLDKLTKSMNEYGKVETIHGEAVLTHPDELSGGQAAVLMTKSTLLFVRSDIDLSVIEWRDVLNNLKLQ